MKVVLFNDDKKVLFIHSALNEVTVTGNNIEWDLGGLRDIKHNFIVLDDDVEVAEVLSDNVISLDKSSALKKIDYKKENEELKERLTLTENAILALMDRGV